MGEDDEPGLHDANASRVARAKLVSAVSLAVVAIACIAYLGPSLQPAAAPVLPANPRFQLDAVNFVSPTQGWVLEDLDDFQFAVLGTTDAGRHWKPELLEPSVSQGEYMRFFDAQHGVVSTPGGEPVLFTTDDGGLHWQRHVVFDIYTFAVSASFTDPLHGFELVGAAPDVPLSSPALVRTSDGGKSWTRLPVAVPAGVQAFAVAFSDAQHGWLDTVAPVPEAYATDDGGTTWRAVALPAPKGGWPVRDGTYFVAVRATPGGGLVAAAVNSPRISGRTSGIDVLGYPPLTVRTFDGGGPVVYEYSTFADSPTSAVATENRPGQQQAANQTVMRSADGGASWTVVSPPSTGGTLGFTGSFEWWWVGADAMALTHDGGLTWSPIRIETLDQPVPGSLTVLDARHAWIGAIAKGATVLYTTSDGGARWTAVSLPSLNL